MDLLDDYKLMELERENARHIEIINQEMGDVKDCVTRVKVDLAIVKTDVAWLKKTYWIVVTASLGAMVVGVVQLVINN